MQATRRTLITAAALALAAPTALGQDKTVRFVLPNATGSGVDAITRVAQPALAKALGHPVIVDNQPGAGGIVGLQALLKQRNGEMNYASGGNGTILHLATEMFLDEAGASAKHIPYKGVGPMLTDLIGGQVEFATAALPSVQQHLKSGALKAIGVATAQRVPAAPEIATFAEQGFGGYKVEAWFAVLGPKGLPAAEVARIHAAVTAAFADPAVSETMARQGNVISVQPAAQAMGFFRSEMARYAALVKKAGVEAQ